MAGGSDQSATVLEKFQAISLKDTMFPYSSILMGSKINALNA
jgi:hypothetical protein